ncbi:MULTISPECIES: SDR family NAD(P)-dependent oxidoreductase [Streptomyces]|uniref:Glucose 1-dehydrogenase n=1 Tax=Streptomyces doudnae TaxID=3075536 RepID=A0ABD5F267_9ACTN|nr:MULTISPECIES: glucose 1-dehydrogenase [unclassified Streptomyces]MDT0440517.1 glucose 1-dehydrogenase [Streptomyces sp. DSM 41981]MYQ64866.1 glucose 1-dehydrogenase [Streptomyces sp. SID4950]SCD87832.1 NAD(P)-dependent dehydrogenase, short-chain alcohol dehydrogenase family [Streptomyces sp. SolWspMP-5a-2]
MGRLTGKVALVTGGARGIGRGIAELFAAHGAAVTAVDVLDPAAPEGPADPAPRDGTGTLEHGRLDVTDERGWAETVAGVEERHGRLDILVNNAGVGSYEAVHELAPDEWQRVLGVNQTGVYLGMRAAIPALRRSGGGSIINISSIYGAAAVPGSLAYQATKGAVRSMTRNAAVTYAPDNIRANAVLPGWIRTPMTLAQTREFNDAVIASTPLGRGAEPLDIAHGCVYLASDESSYVTGTDLVIDGGFLAR